MEPIIHRVGLVSNIMDSSWISLTAWRDSSRGFGLRLIKMEENKIQVADPIKLEQGFDDDNDIIDCSRG